MIRSVAWGLLFLVPTLILQSTVLNIVAFAGVKPDILLLLFFFLAVHNGITNSTLLGFIFGLILDFSTGSVPGYFSFIFTLAGYILGHWKGKILFDPIAIPILFAFIATFYVAVIGFLLSSIFNLGKSFDHFFNKSFLIQLIWNVVISPIVWLIFHFLRQLLLQSKRGGFDGKN